MWFDDEYDGYGYESRPTRRTYSGYDSDGYAYGSSSDDTDAIETKGMLIPHPKKADSDPDDHYNSASYVFIGIVLKWELNDIAQDNLKLITKLNPLPIKYPSFSSGYLDVYYESFKPFVLEDARASIAAGIDMINAGRIKPVSFVLEKDVQFARNPANPSKMDVNAELLANEDGRSKVAVLLQPVKGSKHFNILGLASEHGFGNANKKTIIKFIIDENMQAQYGNEFKKGCQWRAHILASVLSHERIYEACSLKPELTFLPQIICGAASTLPRSNRVIKSSLNASQQLAISGFAQADDGLYMLQGPPGTGKTTTIVDMIYEITQQKKRILICAPSNKAIQVIAERFYAKYQSNRLAMILVGVEAKLPPSLKPIFLHTWKLQLIELVQQLMKIAEKPEVLLFKKSEEAYSILTKVKLAELKPIEISIKTKVNDYKITEFDYQIKSVLGSIASYLESLKSEENAFWQHVLQCKLDNEVKPLKSLINYRKQQLGILQEIANLVASIKNNKDLEDMLVRNAQVLFSTLSVSGRKQMRQTAKVDVLIVDEAGQTVEAETLIPFILQPRKCLLVGDTKQLPATVISQPAENMGYGRSMMHRILEDCKSPFHMLTMQYRMHPKIRQWPSKQFYNNQLIDGENIQTRISPFPTLLAKAHQPYAFINTTGQEGSAGNSYSNANEAKLIVNFVEYLVKTHKLNPAANIGIISFYAGQVELLRRLMQQRSLNPRINTVDGFQGDENDIIIISFVRSNARNAVGFLRDFRRLNVGITRGRHAVIMFGNQVTLSTDKNLRNLMQHLASQQLIYQQSEFEKTMITAPVVAAAKKIEPTPEVSKKPVQNQSLPSNYKSEQCRHFKKGSCDQGEKCNFAHGKDDTKKLMKPPKAHVAAKNTDIDKPKPKKPSIPLAASAKSKTNCTFFAKGNCKKGEACNMTHAPRGAGSTF